MIKGKTREPKLSIKRLRKDLIETTENLRDNQDTLLEIIQQGIATDKIIVDDEYIALLEEARVVTQKMVDTLRQYEDEHK